MTDEPRNRRYLPKWAENKMNDLERQLAERDQQVADLQAALAGDGRSQFKIDHGSRKDEQSLPAAAKYLLWSPDGGDFEVRLSEDSGQLQIMCTTWQGIAVVPQATNVVHIRPGRSK